MVARRHRSRNAGSRGLEDHLALDLLGVLEQVVYRAGPFNGGVELVTAGATEAVAAAVIGGTTLYGGRGKALHGVLGGLVIAAVYNGIDLMGLGAAVEDMVVALVLLISITVDSIARGGKRIR